MAKKPIDYQKAVLYKVFNRCSQHIYYIGYTTNFTEKKKIIRKSDGTLVPKKGLSLEDAELKWKAGMKVKAKDLRSEGNDLNEFGYFPKSVQKPDVITGKSEG